MVVTIGKEDLVKSISTATTLGKTDTFSRILDILNNQAIQQILLRIVGRILPEQQQQQQQEQILHRSNPQQSNPIQSLSGEAIFQAVIDFLEGYSVTNPEMTIKELKEKLTNEREKVIGVINAYLTKR